MKQVSNRGASGGTSRDLVEMEEGRRGELLRPPSASSRELSDAEKGFGAGRHLALQPGWLDELPTSSVRALHAPSPPRARAMLPAPRRVEVGQPTLVSPLRPFAAIRWEDVEVVQRSHDGANGGVILLSSFEQPDAVFKAGDPGKEQLLATIFLAFAGFMPPKIDMIRQGSDAYGAIGKLCAENGLEDQSPLVTPSGQGSTHLIRMEMVEGFSLNDPSSGGKLASEEKGAAQDFFRELGRLIVFDALVGNDDRICLSLPHTNLGNIMFDVRRRALSPIDQKCPLLFRRNEGAAQDRARRRIFTSLASQSRSIANSVVERLPVSEADRQSRAELVAQGLELARAEIASPAYMKPILEALHQAAPQLDLPRQVLVELWPEDLL